MSDDRGGPFIRGEGCTKTFGGESAERIAPPMSATAVAWPGWVGANLRPQQLAFRQIYAPYQHLEAIRVLGGFGRGRGCRIYSCGVDPTASLLAKTSSFRGRDYLQEVRSVLLVALNLARAARQQG